jgi:adenylate kinase
MNLVLLGPPGSGKGTQAKRVAQRRDLQHLATGDMLRAAIESGSALGRSVRAIMDSGALVPDDTIIALIRGWIRRRASGSGFILDGFPRTVAQAQALDHLLTETGAELDVVIELEVDETALIDRLSGRFSCANCGASYHQRTHQPQVEGVCDICGSNDLVCRPDDRPEAVRTRLEVYRRQTAPLLPYYGTRHILQKVNGMAGIDAVTSQIETILNAVMPLPG